MKITEVANALVAVIKGIEGIEGAYLWERKDIKVPAGSVGVPTLERTDVDEAESQLGTDDWKLEFPVSLYFDLADVAKSQQSMVDALEAFTNAIDADQSLGLPTVEASVNDAQPFAERDRKRPLVGYEITVSVLRLV